MGTTARRIKFLAKLSRLLSYADALGIKIICTDFHRTAKQQAARYAKGRTKPGKIVTFADGYSIKSKHQDWEAGDLCVIKDGKIEWGRVEEYELLGAFWKRIGCKWGGDWANLNDIYHFEL